MRERKRKNFTQSYKSNFLVGKASTVIVGIGLVFMFGVLFISQSNTIAAKSDTLSDLQTKKDQLTAEKQRLEVEATRLQSIQEIEKAQSGGSSSSKLVPVQQINYLPASNVALK